MVNDIIVRGARLHNLKNITVSIPRNKLVVLTGVSGSGKSTLGFDILLKEGQRQYMESLGILPFGMSHPPVGEIIGLSPTISIDQRLTNHSPRSTVGTITQVYTYLRVLFARLGHRPCSNCGQDLPLEFISQSGDVTELSAAEDAEDEPERTFACPQCGHLNLTLTMASFSFNKPAGACPTCTGLGIIQQANLQQLIDEEKSIPQGAVTGWNELYIRYQTGILQAAATYYGFSWDLNLPIKAYSPVQRDLLFYGVDSLQFRRHFPGINPPATVRGGKFEGVATALLRRQAEHIQEEAYSKRMNAVLMSTSCPDCHGDRLRPESRIVTVDGKTIMTVAHLSLTDMAVWLDALEKNLISDEARIAAPLLIDLKERIRRLVEVGAGYLSIDRAAPTLSAGESQRLKLTLLLASGLTGVLYVFDEPTIGLHQRDTLRLIGFLRRLRDLGNTILVIEHDLETIAAADHVIDFGPGAGHQGGRIIAQGNPAEIASNPDSVTGTFLSQRQTIPVPPNRRRPGSEKITVMDAGENNLKNLTVDFPLGLLIAVTGVSGSGKSSLVFDTLDLAIRSNLKTVKVGSIIGTEKIKKVVTIDQEHIGLIPRSNAATYTDTFSAIRTAFAATEEAIRQNISSKYFSFNVPGGRCERCQGMGTLTVKMHFLPDVEVNCPVCHGKRFSDDVLGVHYRGYDISQVLDMTMEEALVLFQDIPAARSRLQVLNDVGLGYLQLGQPATTLSGGEAQRIKLAKELGRRAGGHTLYLLDEPTTGMHLADTVRLLMILQRLVEAGNTVVVVEHNLELVKTADWVIDLGPEGGAAGGEVIAVGTPEMVAETPGSITGQYLRKILA